MQADVEMMQSYVSKYGKVGMTSVLHLKEAIVFLTEKPEILQQAVFVDILKRHEGKVRSQSDSKRFRTKRSWVGPNIIELSQIFYLNDVSLWLMRASLSKDVQSGVWMFWVWMEN